MNELQKFADSAVGAVDTITKQLSKKQKQLVEEKMMRGYQLSIGVLTNGTAPPDIVLELVDRFGERFCVAKVVGEVKRRFLA